VADKINMKNLPKDYIIFDIETTGFSGKTDKVTEIAAIKYIEGKKIAEFNVLFNWNIPIPPKITELTTITKELLDVEGIDPQKAYMAFIEFIGNSLPVIGHNILRFDIPFLNGNFENSLGHLGFRVIDTAALYKMKKLEIIASEIIEVLNRQMIDVLNARHSIKYSIDTACAEFNIDKSKITRHRAMGDCIVTNELYKILAQ